MFALERRHAETYLKENARHVFQHPYVETFPRDEQCIATTRLGHVETLGCIQLHLDIRTQTWVNQQVHEVQAKCDDISPQK